MAWLSGYNKRIKLTIDHTKVDSTLSNFPVTVFFTAAQAEEIFSEFDADSDYMKCAFTSSDGTTQLYAEKELFDVSESKAIYHVKVTSVSSSADTDIYYYYDNDASDNTTYIGAINTTAGGHVWDSNFKAVYHMVDADADYDTKYDGSVKPDSDGWTLDGTDYASSDGDILTIDTSADDTFICNYYKTPDVDFDAGFYFKLYAKLISGRLTVNVNDETQSEALHFNIYTTDVKWWNGSNQLIKSFDTTDDYHLYEVYIKGTSQYFYIDGVLEATGTVWNNASNDIVQFGDNTSTYNVKVDIDYFNFALNVATNPIINILDSTSNSNDGTKKATNEPIGVTGKVGQGQDFDGTDDYINTGFNISGATNFTALIVQKYLTAAQDDCTISNDDDGYDSSWRIRVNNSKISLNIQNGVGTQINHDSATDADTTNYHAVSYVKAGTSHSLYIDGALDGNAETLTQTPNANSILLGRRVSSTANYADFIGDEVRFSLTNRSAAWIKATYNSLWDSLLSYGSEEEAPPSVDNAIFFGAAF